MRTSKFEKGFSLPEILMVIGAILIVVGGLLLIIDSCKDQREKMRREAAIPEVTVSRLDYGFLELEKDSTITPDYTKTKQLSSLEVGKQYLMVITFDCLPSTENEKPFSLKVNIEVERSDCIDAYVEEASTSKTAAKETNLNGNPVKTINLEYGFTIERIEKTTETIVLRLETKSAVNAAFNIYFQGENCVLRGDDVDKTKTIPLKMVAPEMRTTASVYPARLAA